MIIKPDTYVPSLRWRMGEYQALSRLSDSAKDRVAPFIVVPEIEFDFEKWQPAKTLQDHVAPFADRYKKKWDTRPAWIDVHPKIQASLMDDGKLPIAHVFDALRPLGTSAVPVVSLDGSPAINAAVAAAVKLDGRGVGGRGDEPRRHGAHAQARRLAAAGLRPRPPPPCPTRSSTGRECR